jgi:biotin synthase
MFGERQGEIFAAGANSIVIGNYLTTAGRAVDKDLEMLASLGLGVATSVAN